MTVGARTFRLTRFDVQPPNLTLQITPATVVAQPGETPARMSYSLTDSAGKVIWTLSAPSSTSASIALGTSAGPYKLEIHVPDKSVEIPVHFVLQDIPLP